MTKKTKQKQAFDRFSDAVLRRAVARIELEKAEAEFIAAWEDYKIYLEGVK